MGFAVTEVCEKVRQGNSDLHEKKRVWGNFENPNKTRPVNRRQPLKTRLEKPTYAYKIASGRPLYRYYDPNNARFINRDPLGDSVFKAQYLKQTYGPGTLPATLLARAKYHAVSSSAENAFLSQQEKIIFADLLSVEEASIYSNYHFVDNNPTNFYDKLGLNRGVAYSLGRLHWELQVDSWKVEGGKYVSDGFTQTGFGPDGELHVPLSIFWGAKKGIVWIYTHRGRAKNEIESSPCQDIAALESLKAADSSPPPYQVASSNCQHFVADHLDDGMDEPGIGKCCNPDGTIWKP